MIIIGRAVMKNYTNFFLGTLYFKLHMLYAAPLYSPVYLFSNISLQIIKTFVFSYDSCYSFVNNFIFLFLKLIIFIACFVKDSQNCFIQSLPLYASFLFSMILNDDTVDIEKPDGIFSLTLL